MEALRGLIAPTMSGGAPSEFVALAALLWTHITAARSSGPNGAKDGSGDNATLWTFVNWKKRVYTRELGNHFGNTVTMA
jgi:hypothetical protein